MEWQTKLSKLHARGSVLSDRMYQKEAALAPFVTWEKQPGNDLALYMQPPIATEVRQLGEGWESTDGYLYLLAKLRLPPAKYEHMLCAQLDFSSIHEGYGHGFEATLYINGQPWHGVDDNHMLIPLEGWGGQTVELLFVLWAGITGKSPAKKTHILRRAEIGYVNCELENLATLFEMTLETLETLAANTAPHTALLQLASATISMIHWDENAHNFCKSAQDAYRHLQDGMRQLRKPSADYMLHCAGHTHIDYAWLWRVKHTREKLIHSFSTVIRLLEEFPEYQFFQSTPEFYKCLEQDAPGLYQQVRQAVASGRWEVGGGMWVEADCNLISGESMVRQILYAKKFFWEEFGVEDKVVWLPDAFGFSWAMPQILKKSGIEVFFTSKLSWNRENRFPNDTFYWEGPDGSRVLASFLTVPANGFPPQPWAVTYNGDIGVKALKQTWEMYQNKDISADLLYLYGHGDGGGGSTRSMVKRLKALQNIPVAPPTRFASVGELFSTLQASVQHKDVPVWRGELYLECHRGTYTSQAFAKKNNRQLEQRLRNTEFFQVYKRVCTQEQALPVSLEAEWRVLLRNQFHDILPGSSVRAVYEDLRAEYAALHVRLDILDTQYTQFDEDQSGTQPGYTVWNTASWQRDALVELQAGAETTGWEDKTGQQYESVLLDDGRHLVALQRMPALAGCHLLPQRGANSSDGQPLAAINLKTRCIKTPSYIIEWNSDGQLRRIFSIKGNFEVLAPGQTGNQLRVYEDRPAMFDAWDIDSDYVDNFELLQELTAVEIVENNTLRAVLRFSFVFHDSTLQQNLVLYRDSPSIVFEHRVRWGEHQRLLRAEFPLNIHASNATFDMPFGNLERPTHRNTAFEQARFEVVGHKWADLSQRERGVSLLNNCKYGHSVNQNRLGLSLIKSAIDPDETADQGMHSYCYALHPHTGGWLEAGTHKLAHELNSPPYVARGTAAPAGQQLFAVQGGAVEIDCIKPSECGRYVLLRLHEYGGGSWAINIDSDFEVSGYCSCDLMENRDGSWFEKDAIEFSINPYEIKTFLVQIK